MGMGLTEIYYGLGAWGSVGAGTEADFGGGAGIISSKNPGRNRSIRSCVAAHKAT